MTCVPLVIAHCLFSFIAASLTRLCALLSERECNTSSSHCIRREGEGRDSGVLLQLSTSPRSSSFLRGAEILFSFFFRAHFLLFIPFAIVCFFSPLLFVPKLELLQHNEASPYSSFHHPLIYAFNWRMCKAKEAHTFANPTLHHNVPQNTYELSRISKKHSYTRNICSGLCFPAKP